MVDAARFLRDVRGHQMTIEVDDGVHRSICFGRQGSSAWHFRLVTWPGGLSVSGDCDDLMFFRAHDMFDFFRDTSMTGAINPGYWHEKLPQTIRGGEGTRRFSVQKFHQAVKDATDEWEVRMGDVGKIQQDLSDQLLTVDFSNESEAYEAIEDFETHGHRFEDFEGSHKDYTFGYLWAIRAIVWGIKQYDLVKQGRTQADHDRLILKGEI